MLEKSIQHFSKVETITLSYNGTSHWPFRIRKLGLQEKLIVPYTTEILRARTAVHATARNSTTSHAIRSHSLASSTTAPVLPPVTTYTVPPSIEPTFTAEGISRLQVPPQPLHMMDDAHSSCNLSQDFIDGLHKKAQRLEHTDALSAYRPQPSSPHYIALSTVNRGDGDGPLGTPVLSCVETGLLEDQKYRSQSQGFYA